MKCSNCGADIEPGKLYCTLCGQEVQLVPEYDTMGNYMRQKEKEKAQEAEELRRHEEMMRRKHRQEEAEKKKRKKMSFLIGCGLLIACICGLLIFKWVMDRKNFNSYDFQMDRAEAAFSNHNYEKALEYVERAVTLAGEGNHDASMLQAQILMGQDKNEEAVKVLEGILKEDPENGTCFGMLIRLFESQDNMEQIKELLSECKSDKLKEKYSSYIAGEAVFGLIEGTYHEPKKLELYAPSGKDTIYYTTDGSNPTKDSSVYSQAIELNEGTTVVKTMIVNERGITGEITKNTYVIELNPPEPPAISPSSGVFTRDMMTKIYVIVPADCKAYYAFDEKPTPESGTLYTGPVDMLEGDHTFYAILVDKYGKASMAGSQTYVLE